MTETTGGPTGGTASGSGGSSTRDAAKQEAQGVAQDAAQSGRATAETAKQQASEVAGEVQNQTRQLLEQARDQLNSQGGEQKARATTGLRSLADELSGLVQGEGTSNGMVADLAREASDRVRTTADWLETHEPGDVLSEARQFARRRPGMFLLGAAAVGFLGGRVTRSLGDGVKEYAEAEQATGTSGPQTGGRAPHAGGGVGGSGYVEVSGPAEPVAPGTRSGPAASEGLELPDEAPGTPGYTVPPTTDDQRGVEGTGAQDVPGRGRS